MHRVDRGADTSGRDPDSCSNATRDAGSLRSLGVIPRSGPQTTNEDGGFSDGVFSLRRRLCLSVYFFLQRLIPVVVLAGWLLPNEVRNRHRTKSGAHDHPSIEPSPGLSLEPPPGSALDEDEEADPLVASERSPEEIHRTKSGARPHPVRGDSGSLCSRRLEPFEPH